MVTTVFSSFYFWSILTLAAVLYAAWGLYAVFFSLGFVRTCKRLFFDVMKSVTVPD